MVSKKNIRSISVNALCTACGACCGVCPSKAIIMKTNTSGYLLADVDEDKCINCGICYNVCPSTDRNPPQKEDIDIFHGKSICGYIGYATDKEIRQKSQSGGIVTALLCYLLERKLVDGAVINTFEESTQRSRSVFAETKEKIIEGCGSYYTQSSVVDTILKSCKGKKSAAVTLGCQAESLRLINENYPNVELPEYVIGLVCAGQNSSHMISDLVKQSGCRSNETVIKFRFRDKNIGGWPGNVSIHTDKSIYYMDKKKRHAVKPVYEAYRCIMCFDQMNIYSDIVVGDPWGFTLGDSEYGYSVVIARTEKGKKLLEEAMHDGIINMEMISVDKIIKGQTVDDRHKTKFFTSLGICKKNGWQFPYNELCFEDIEYQKADERSLMDLAERMEYTRKVYFENSKDNLEKMVQAKKMKIKRKEIISYPGNFLKRCIGYIMRKTHLKRSR
ncbi:MAG: Coenzyme F420 hydrogenase/dehydrogenase, beta subunit C-terminal domain [Lutisporaceae bacterium]